MDAGGPQERASGQWKLSLTQGRERGSQGRHGARCDSAHMSLLHIQPTRGRPVTSLSSSSREGSCWTHAPPLGALLTLALGTTFSGNHTPARGGGSGHEQEVGFPVKVFGAPVPGCPAHAHVQDREGPGGRMCREHAGSREGGPSASLPAQRVLTPHSRLHVFALFSQFPLEWCTFWNIRNFHAVDEKTFS